MYVSADRAALAVQLLIEGNSIRSTERITKLDRNTIMRVLVLAGERCEKLLADTIIRVKVGIPVKVNADSGGKPNGIPERR